ncbi:SusC/RagA family TonB-linked outer membrane protein [Sphingobacterium bovistauri]|uniref:TonB-dependent receptor n=1 Tax=Sphingobacterium bovistauri TaxID=2781959 RepID=A0ABS7Z857_9SPHI|nr:TonB-dependent receptor [Sphingobacterium bovistauri]MCA5005050.1 TonB-dependent receptor [Sphingobacterium bovistauri]
MNIQRVNIYALAILLHIFSVLSSSAQVTKPIINASLVGTVIDAETKEPIEGATVQLEAVTHSVKTDRNGKFQFVTGQKLPFTATISYVGYVSQKNVFKTSPAIVELKPKSNGLEEVVVVGYGTQRKADLVGAVSKVDASKTKVIPEASFDTQLQGNVAGVQINGGTGIPGGNTFIRVRGSTSINSSNDPLYVIDGIFVNNTSLQNSAADRTTSPLADLNPNDIETIEVLKDAAAISIYGSKGANGVILITTKKGKYGQTAKVDVELSQGFGYAPKKWDLTSGSEHALLVEEYRKNEGLAPVFTAGTRGLPKDQPTYDRQAILNKTAGFKNYNVAVRGGGDQTVYYIAGGYNDQEGVWKTMGFERGSFRINLEQKINEKIKVGTTNTFSRSKREIGRAVGSGNTGGLYQASVDIPTYLPLFDESGKALNWVNFDNISSLVNNTDNSANSNHYIGSIYGNYNILPNLVFKTSFSVDYNIYEEREYWNTNLLRGIANNGEAIASYTQSDFWVNEQTLRYNKIADRHSFAILVGNHIQSSTTKNTFSRGTNFPNNSFKLISAAANQTVDESWGSNTMLSFFSRLEYNFNNKYFVEGVFRADGSSKFAKDNLWGYFPAVGLAWKISKENFLKDHKVLNNLKLRVNYGIAGNQSGIGDFKYRGLWIAGEGYPDIGTTELPGIKPLQLANPNLKWEETAQFNIGADVGLFKDLIALDLNYYNKRTTDALLEVAVENYSGFQSYLSNYGQLSNKGFEIGLNANIFTKKPFNWISSFNISQNKNKIEVLPNPMSFEDRQFIRIEQGYPLYSYWLYNVQGVDSQTGDLQIEDVNKDGQITASDRKIVGDSWPKFFGGWSNNFSYKGFDLNVLFTYSFGNNVWNHNRALGEQGGKLDANRVLFATQLDRWQKPGDITDVPRLALKNYDKQELSRFFEDGSFLRLRSFNFGYTLPKSLISKIHLDKARVYFVGTNLFLLTKYTGADPETRIERGESQNIQGYDFASPPTPRTFQLGINLTL